MRDHRLIDQRSLAFGSAIAARLAREPQLVAHARTNLTRWMTTASPRAISTMREWLAILDGPLQGVLDVLTNSNERAVRLRQSNPFAGVLSNSERNAIILEFEAHDAAAT